MTLRLALVLFLVVTPVVAQAPTPASARDAARSYRSANELKIIAELRALLAIPNVAADRENIARNADLLRKMLEARGVRTQLLTVEGAPPSVYGELRTPRATRTVVFYAHFDGQPVEPARWATPPWDPTMRSAALEAGGEIVPWERLQAPIPGEYRIYGRSASDDKSPIVAALAALDSLQAAQIPLSVNLKFFLEGEEEAGSPNLERLLKAHSKLLAADAWIMADGPVHQSREMQVAFGVRGSMDLEITAYGPARALHSGHYGNWAPNPAAELATLLAGMRDSEGRILIPCFYDDVVPLSPAEQKALESNPRPDEKLQHDFALGRTEKVRGRLSEAIIIPALNVRGIRSGAVGEQAANAIPTEAQASIDFRLVPDVTPEKVRSRVEAHLRAKGYHIVHQTPDAETRRRHPRLVKLDWGTGYPGHKTSMDLPASQAIIRVIESARGGPVVKVPGASGGSLPIYLFHRVLGAPLVLVPMVNHDNNQHAHNENLRIQNLWDGIENYAALFAALGAEWR